MKDETIIEINQKSDKKWTIFDATMTAENEDKHSVGLNIMIEAWAVLVKTKIAYLLQNWFGKTAQSLIEANYLNEDGVINWEVYHDDHTGL